MRRLVCEGVQLDYTNLYGQNVVFNATVVLAKDDEGKWYVESATAEEDNEVFGVKKGEQFDPGDTLDIDQLLSDYSPISETMTATEADERWGLQPGTVRASCLRGPLSRYIEKGLVRKSGGTWLVAVQAMEEVYGKEPGRRKL